MTGKLGEPWFRKKYPSLLGSERRHNFTKENTDNQYVHSQGATTLYNSVVLFISSLFSFQHFLLPLMTFASVFWSDVSYPGRAPSSLNAPTSTPEAFEQWTFV
jgi:predicted metalloprotease with PDZ domain